MAAVCIIDRMASIRDVMRRIGAGRWLAGAVLPLCFGEPAYAQSAPRILVQLRGQMVDSAGRAIAGVRLRVVGSGRSTISDSVGWFAIDSLPVGFVSVSFTHSRFASITLDLPLVADDTTRIPVLLTEPEEPVVHDLAPGTLFGAVLDPRGFPVVGAEVLVASTGQTMTTDSLGRFAFAGLRPSPHLIRVRRIGFYVQYLSVTTTLHTAVRARVALEPMGATLAEVVVRADRVAPRLKRFFERKAHDGFGQFVARGDFAEQGWTSLTEILSHMRGVTMGSDAMGRPTPMTHFDCPMRVLLDGLPLELEGVSLTALVNIRDLAGVEVYRRGTEAPLEFTFGGGRSGGCGVIVLWTR